MRINRFFARSTDLSRRSADLAISEGRVSINSRQANVGDEVSNSDLVMLDGSKLSLPQVSTLLMLNKPVGYVCSRNGQGNNTVYSLIPREFHRLKTIGRLDKNSSGLLLLTDDGIFAQQLAHPSANKLKQYEIKLERALTDIDHEVISSSGVQLDDGNSRFDLRLDGNDRTSWIATLSEGRNRQIRRTFSTLGYTVIGLHRFAFGPYRLDELKKGKFKKVDFIKI